MKRGPCACCCGDRRPRGPIPALSSLLPSRGSARVPGEPHPHPRAPEAALGELQCPLAPSSWEVRMRRELPLRAGERTACQFSNKNILTTEFYIKQRAAGGCGFTKAAPGQFPSSATRQEGPPWLPRNA